MNQLPNGWASASLEELQAVEERAITDGPFGSKLASRHYTTSGARVIRLQNIGDGFFRDERAYISLEYFTELRTHEVRAGDLVIASLGDELPRACIIPELEEPAIVKADCIRARLHPRVEAKWVLYALSSPQTRQQARTHIRGVGRPRLGLGALRKIMIPLPPLEEQRRITETLESHLSHLDAAAQSIRADIRRLGMLAKRTILDAVPIPSPGHWQVATVADAGLVDLGRQRHPDWHSGPHMRPYLRVANVFEDRIDISDLMEMDFPPDVFERYRLSKGDILLNEGQSPEFLGRPAMYKGDPPEVAFTNSLIRFRARPDIMPEWALLVFRRHMRAGRFMDEVRISTNIAHLSASRFKTVEFPIPPVEEQEGIVADVGERLTRVEWMRQTLEGSLARMASLRRTLIAEAVAGRLVPQHAEAEPGTVLLERIRGERASASRSRRRIAVAVTKGRA